MKAKKQYQLDVLLKQQPLLWKASEQHVDYQSAGASGLDTGFKALNKLLTTGGWPRSSLIEIQVDEWGQGELQVLLPMMAALSRQKQQLAWIAPPYTPYAPALHAAGVDLDYLLIIEQSEPADIAWAAEKCLQHAAAALVIFCLPLADARHIRRLQIAADTGGTIGVLLHCGPVRQTPVPLRLKTRYVDQGLCVEILKSRFGLEQGRQVLLEHAMLAQNKGNHSL
ncbi:MAG: translesion DNA synthesis-associated protein ImuA [Proteobacteria bacterium]|nr:translesion DNA synthesis-associated protein ImuA [Pseudomonadota bacterium]